MRSHPFYLTTASAAAISFFFACAPTVAAPQSPAPRTKAPLPAGAAKAARLRKATKTPTVKPGADISSGGVGMTIYNDNFAVVRHPVRVTLKKGTNRIQFENVSALIEADSVVLRDPSGRHDFRILEQSYRNDTAAVDRLLPLFEGKTLQFLVQSNLYAPPTTDKPQIVTGKLIRAGTTSSNYNYLGGGFTASPTTSAIVEVDGKLRFGLPGAPIFPPASMGGLLLYPTLQWTLSTQTPGPMNAELAYITGGLAWKASYNLVAPDRGETIDLIGWVTMNNATGRTYANARIQLLAGNVRKISSERSYGFGGFGVGGGGGLVGGVDTGPPPISEKGFDEYHLYTLRYPATLRDREQKQVEMARASGIRSARLYVYDGERVSPLRYDWLSPIYNDDANYEGYAYERNTNVWVMREFVNSTANNLGIPLPQGRMRVYRREDQTGALQFVGEGMIGHTPKDETIRLYTGDAFDIVGQRRLVALVTPQVEAATPKAEGTRQDRGQRNRDRNRQENRQEKWEIKLRNHKKEPVEVRIVEHMHPWRAYPAFWEIANNSDPWIKRSAFTVEFRVVVKPDEEKVVTYSVNY